MAGKDDARGFPVPWTHVAVLLCGLAGGGGAGSFATGSYTANSVAELASEIKSLRREVLLEMKHVGVTSARIESRMSLIEAGISSHENRAHHTGTDLTLSDIKRRLSNLEKGR